MLGARVLECSQECCSKKAWLSDTFVKISSRYTVLHFTCFGFGRLNQGLQPLPLPCALCKSPVRGEPRQTCRFFSMFFSWLRWIFSINCNVPAILWSLLASGLHSLVWDGASAYQVFWAKTNSIDLLPTLRFFVLIARQSSLPVWCKVARDSAFLVNDKAFHVFVLVFCSDVGGLRCIPGHESTACAGPFMATIARRLPGAPASGLTEKKKKTKKTSKTSH